MFSVLLVCADSYQAPPIPPLDPTFSEFRGSEIRHVPVIRVFGSTSTGEKTCLHIHGVFPYMYVPYTGEEDGDSLAYRLAASLDSAINISLGSAGSNIQHVFKIQRVSGVPFYGYHTREHQFFKIYFYNPAMVKRAADLLQNGSVLDRSLQPHEAHIPYVMQFMIDYNLYGMSAINLLSVKHRRPALSKDEAETTLDGGSLDRGRAFEEYLPTSVLRQSSCKLEVDAWASDILNRRTIQKGMELNPGLEAIWEEEKTRRSRAGLGDSDSQLVNPKSPSRPFCPPTENDLYQKRRLEQRLLRISQNDESILFTNSNPSSYPIESSEKESLLNASYIETHVGSSVRNQSSGSITRGHLESHSLNESIQGRLQGSSVDSSILDANDLSLMELLANLACDEEEDKFDEDSVLSSQRSGMPEDPKSDNEDEAVDLNLTCLELDTLSSWDLSQKTNSQTRCIDKDIPAGCGSLRCSQSVKDATLVEVECFPQDRFPQLDGAGDLSPNKLITEESRHISKVLPYPLRETAPRGLSNDLDKVRVNNSQHQNPGGSASSHQAEALFDLNLSSTLTDSLYNIEQYGGVFNELFTRFPDGGPDLSSDLENLQSTVEIGMLSPSIEDASEASNESTEDEKIPLDMVLTGDPCFTESAVFDRSDLTELRDQYVSLLGSALLPDVHLGPVIEATRGPDDASESKREKSEAPVGSRFTRSHLADGGGNGDGGSGPSSENVTPNIQEPENASRGKVKMADGVTEAPETGKEVATWEELQNLRFVEKQSGRRRRTRRNGKQILHRANNDGRNERTPASKSKRNADASAGVHSDASFVVSNRIDDTTIKLVLRRERMVDVESVRNDPNRKTYACKRATALWSGKERSLHRSPRNRKQVLRGSHDASQSGLVQQVYETSRESSSVPSECVLTHGELASLLPVYAFPVDDVRETLPGTQCSKYDSVNGETLVDEILRDFEEAKRCQERSEKENHLTSLTPPIDSHYSYYCSQQSHNGSIYGTRSHVHCEIGRKDMHQNHVHSSEHIWVIEKRKRGKPKRFQPVVCTKTGCLLPVIFLEKMHVNDPSPGNTTLVDENRCFRVAEGESSCRDPKRFPMESAPCPAINQVTIDQRKLIRGNCEVNPTPSDLPVACSQVENPMTKRAGQSPSKTASPAKVAVTVKSSRNLRGIIGEKTPVIISKISPRSPTKRKQRLVLVKLHKALDERPRGSSTFEKSIGEKSCEKSSKCHGNSSLPMDSSVVSDSKTSLTSSSVDTQGDFKNSPKECDSIDLLRPISLEISPRRILPRRGSPKKNFPGSLNKDETYLKRHGTIDNVADEASKVSSKASSLDRVPSMELQLSSAFNCLTENVSLPVQLNVSSEFRWPVRLFKEKQVVNSEGLVTLCEPVLSICADKESKRNASGSLAELLKAGESELKEGNKRINGSYDDRSSMDCLENPIETIDQEKILSLARRRLSPRKQGRRGRRALDGSNNNIRIILPDENRTKDIDVEVFDDKSSAHSVDSAIRIENDESCTLREHVEVKVFAVSAEIVEGSDVDVSINPEVASASLLAPPADKFENNILESNVMEDNQDFVDCAEKLEECPIVSCVEDIGLPETEPSEELDLGGDREKCMDDIELPETEPTSQLDLVTDQPVLPTDDFVGPDSTMDFHQCREYAIDAITSEIPKCLFEEDSNSEEDKQAPEEQSEVAYRDPNSKASVNIKEELSQSYIPDHKGLDVYDLDLNFDSIDVTDDETMDTSAGSNVTCCTVTKDNTETLQSDKTVFPDSDNKINQNSEECSVTGNLGNGGVSINECPGFQDYPMINRNSLENGRTDESGEISVRGDENILDNEYISVESGEGVTSLEEQSEEGEDNVGNCNTDKCSAIDEGQECLDGKSCMENHDITRKGDKYDRIVEKNDDIDEGNKDDECQNKECQENIKDHEEKYNDANEDKSENESEGGNREESINVSGDKCDSVVRKVQKLTPAIEEEFNQLAENKGKPVSKEESEESSDMEKNFNERKVIEDESTTKAIEGNKEDQSVGEDIYNNNLECHSSTTDDSETQKLEKERTDEKEMDGVDSIQHNAVTASNDKDDTNMVHDKTEEPVCEQLKSCKRVSIKLERVDLNRMNLTPTKSRKVEVTKDSPMSPRSKSQSPVELEPGAARTRKVKVKKHVRFKINPTHRSWDNEESEESTRKVLRSLKNKDIVQELPETTDLMKNKQDATEQEATKKIKNSETTKKTQDLETIKKIEASKAMKVTSVSLTPKEAPFPRTTKKPEISKKAVDQKQSKPANELKPPEETPKVTEEVRVPSTVQEIPSSGTSKKIQASAGVKKRKRTAEEFTLKEANLLELNSVEVSTTSKTRLRRAKGSLTRENIPKINLQNPSKKKQKTAEADSKTTPESSDKSPLIKLPKQPSDSITPREHPVLEAATPAEEPSKRRKRTLENEIEKSMTPEPASAPVEDKTEQKIQNNELLKRRVLQIKVSSHKMSKMARVVEKIFVSRKNKVQRIFFDPKLLIVRTSFNEGRFTKPSKKQNFLLHFGLCTVRPDKMEWRAVTCKTAYMQLKEPRVMLQKLSPSTLRKYRRTWKNKASTTKRRTQKKSKSKPTIPALDGAADVDSDSSDEEHPEEEDVTIVREETRVCSYGARALSAPPCNAIVTPVKRKREEPRGNESPLRESPKRSSTLRSPGAKSRGYRPLNIIVTSPKVRKSSAGAIAPECGDEGTSPLHTPRIGGPLRDSLLRDRVFRPSPALVSGKESSNEITCAPEQLGELRRIPDGSHAMTRDAVLNNSVNRETRGDDVDQEHEGDDHSGRVRKRLCFMPVEEECKTSENVDNVVVKPQESIMEKSLDHQVARNIERETKREIESSENQPDVDSETELQALDVAQIMAESDLSDGENNDERFLEIPEHPDGNRWELAEAGDQLIIPRDFDSSQHDDDRRETDEEAEEDALSNLTFTEYMDSRLNKLTQISSHKSELIRGDKNRDVAIAPKFAPPSRKRVIESMEFYGIAKFRNVEAFYSVQSDVAKRKEVSHRAVMVPGKGVTDLAKFKSELNDVTGITLWRRMKANELEQFGGRRKSNLKRGLAGHRSLIIEPLLAPPSVHDVCTWLKVRKYMKKKEESCKLATAEMGPRSIESTSEVLSNTAGQPADGTFNTRGSSENERLGGKSSNDGADSYLKRALENSRLWGDGDESKSGFGSEESGPARRCTDEMLILRGGLQGKGLQRASKSSNESIDSSLRGALENSRFRREGETSKRVHVSYGQIECLTEATAKDAEEENLQNAKAVATHQYLTVLCLEVHVITRGNLLPDPQQDPIQALFYVIQSDVSSASDRKALECGIIAVDADYDASMKRSGYLFGSGVTCPVLYAGNEEALLESLVNLINRHDPDIFIGWEIESLSWGYVFQRASRLNVKLTTRISRVPSARGTKDSLTSDFESHSDIKVTGRIVLDCWRLMRHEAALLSYSFENVMYHVLHERLPESSFKMLKDWWMHPSPGQRWKVVSYYHTKILGTLKLLEQLDLIGRTSELARLFGIQFFEVLSRGSQFRVESMMLRLAKPLNYIPVSPSVQQRAKMRAPEALPLIMEPESTFYVDPLVVLDFQSLYPSIIIAHNYCFSTCLGRIEHIGQPHPFDFGATSLKISKSTALRLEGKINFSPCGVAFVKSSVRRGILPRMLKEILDTRLMVKKAMKDHPQSDRTLQRALHSRQLGLKLIANVTYGYTAANFSGRMPCIEVGDSVVSKGKETLERAIKLVESTPKWGARVVYGDTDSLFVLLPGKSREEAFKVGAEIADAVTESNPNPIKLKFEKILQPSILQTKKRYCGYMYETPDQAEPEFLAKGIETVRRDGCPAVGKILEKSLKILFDTKDVSLVKQYVTRQLDKILRGSVSFQDLTFAKEFRGMRGYKAAACVPALELTKRLLRNDPRAVPRNSERVRYIVVAGAPNEPLINCIRTPWELIEDPGLRPNATYYITRVIIPPLNRCFNLFGVDVNAWYNELPRRQTPRKSVPLPKDKQKMTISQYFDTMACAVCGICSSKEICVDCAVEPSRVLVVLHEKIRQAERSYCNIVKICQSCTGRTDAADCVSLDCPNLYRRAQSRRAYEGTIRLQQLIESGSNLNF
ncbi:uncharacterized protein LOC105697279 isoform X2 [Orussus abietinus]|uniref:uncharacterized protein LOC105697279 isoform X2 n=1 Tax=Orussus abietinus TaxID=222816 RepID=UPI000625E769|nr:uncharacterized protein LOC105697279 isoform X2 [Orussus abietinus]